LSIEQRNDACSLDWFTIQNIPSSYPSHTIQLDRSIESCLQARAGSVNAKIGGVWQEFSHYCGPNRDTFSCRDGRTGILEDCSKDDESEALGDNDSPWTVQSSSCLKLTVMEGYVGGQAVFEVFDNLKSIGKTTDIPIAQGAPTCTDDPMGCNVGTGVSKGSFILQKNVPHSLHIVARRSDCSNGISHDGGWFKLEATPCGNGNADDGGVVNPPQNDNNDNPADNGSTPSQGGCANAKEECGNGVQCCAGLTCRQNPVNGKRKCRKPGFQPQSDCANAKEWCGQGVQCCSGLVCRRNPVNGKRKCRKPGFHPQSQCARWKDRCGQGVQCCAGLVCRADQVSGIRKCRRKKNSGGGGTTMGPGGSGGIGNGGGDAVPGPMGIGVP
jgi:hypothetical protein